MPQTTSDATVLRKERAEAMKQLLAAGARMSNLCFQIQQCSVGDFAKHGFGERVILEASELQEAWDRSKTRWNAAKDKV
jgi:hypothetical protein